MSILSVYRFRWFLPSIYSCIRILVYALLTLLRSTESGYHKMIERTRKYFVLQSATRTLPASYFKLDWISTQTFSQSIDGWLPTQMQIQRADPVEAQKLGIHQCQVGIGSSATRKCESRAGYMPN